jgi:peptidoglycan/xylan/chitin deacetylase (PgdA/CDA1 family)
MLIEQLPGFTRKIFKEAIWRKNPAEKIIYLTFDDGPIPEVTPWVLDVLDQFQIKSTFFCVGENVQKYPHIYNELIARGHKTGNHTFNHTKGLFKNNQEYLDNIEKAAFYIKSDLFRPPHGALKISQLNKLKKKYKIIQWDVISRDYNKDLSGEEVLNIVKKYTRNGSIIVFHDSVKAEKNMRYAMPRAIEFLLAKGFSFATL